MGGNAIGSGFGHRPGRLKFRGSRLWMVMLQMLAAVALLAALGTASAEAARDPLMEVLIRKGILTPKEAEDVEKEAKALEQEKQKQVEKQVNEQVTQTVTQQVEKKATGWKVPDPLKGLKVGVLAYVDYSNGSVPLNRFQKNSLNQFTLGRGYLNVQKEITPWLHARITPDLTQDSTGDWKLRLKYLYTELRPPNLGQYLTSMKSEIGLGHIPWLDFEEHINPYRCQGTMPIERAGVMNSADLGVNIRGYFGGRVPNSKQVIGDDHYDGLYGSWHLGVYQGPGYHAPERNDNKALEGRLTIRPLPYHLPGLQFSYFGLFGKGNQSTRGNFATTPAAYANKWRYLDYFPDWIVHMGMLSYQHPWFTLMGEVFASKGNQAGNWTIRPVTFRQTHAQALWTQGFSLFGDVKLPIQIFGENRLHVFGRTDWFNADVEQLSSRDAKYTKLITGMACEVYKKNLVLLAFERTWYGNDYNQGTGYNGTSARVADPTTNNTCLGADARFQVVWQISY